jgi:uncharacterized protein (UPF0335 family)
VTEGHNSNAQFKSIIERAINIEDERKGLGEDLKDLWAEAKSHGFDVPAMKEVVKLNREDAVKKQKRESKEAIVETYMKALGQISDLPLGKAAMERAGIKEGSR